MNIISNAFKYTKTGERFLLIVGRKIIGLFCISAIMAWE